MNLTKQVLKNCKEALEYFENNPEHNAYIRLRNGDEQYIEFIVQRGSWYFGMNSLIYFDGQIYGFCFDKSLFDTESEEEK